MIRQSGETRRPKKHLSSSETRFKKRQVEDDRVIDTDIEPAEFFDPEEFGYRKHREPLHP